jgi:CHASE3 domain sensor protein
VIRKLERFVSALKDTETGQRGYLLTGEDRYLEPYKAGQADVARVTEELQRLGSSGDLPANGVQRLNDLTVKKLAELQETINLRRGRDQQATVEVVRSGRGQQLMDQIRTVVGEMQASKEAEFRKARARAANANVARTITFIVVALVKSGFPLPDLQPFESGNGAEGDVRDGGRAGEGVARYDPGEPRGRGDRHGCARARYIAEPRG